MAAVLSLSFLFLAIGQSAIGPVPTEAAKLAEWLLEDPGTARIWQALDSLAGASIEPAVRRILLEHLVERVSPADFERRLGASPESAPRVLSFLGEALASSDQARVVRIQDFIARSALSRSQDLARRGPPWGRESCEALLSLQFVDVERFISDEVFRARVLPILPKAIDPGIPGELKDLLLYSLNNVPGIDFTASERIESSWGAIHRRSLEREVPYDEVGATSFDDIRRSIEASIYSLPSRFFTASEIIPFLEAVRALAPQRTLLALVDMPVREEIQRHIQSPRIHFIETYGRNYSPWPRDPFLFLHRNDGGLLVLLRPKPRLQRGRDEDELMGLELVQGLPASLDEAWGNPRVARSPVTFHNGQVLVTPDHIWVSLHSLEPRVLELLGRDRLPLDAMSTRAGLAGYLDAAREAAAELRALYGRELGFVHPLPGRGQGEDLAASLRRIGGGAGFDLDSVLTLLQGPEEGLEALVGRVEAGRRLLESAPERDLEAFGSGFGLKTRGALLRKELDDAQRVPRALALDEFLDLVAQELDRKGLTVHRIPLFFVPTRLLSEPSESGSGDFLITWNNVVLEERDGRRAEGFASLLPYGDERAREIFNEAGYTLDLLPPLVSSVIRNGGYRCASQHVRAAE